MNKSTLTWDYPIGIGTIIVDRNCTWTNATNNMEDEPKVEEPKVEPAEETPKEETPAE